MRNTKILMINELSKSKRGFRRKDIALATDHSVTDWKTIRSKPEAGSLLATGHDESIRSEPEVDSLPATSHNLSIQNEPGADSLLATTHDETPPYELEANSLLATHHDVSINDNGTSIFVEELMLASNRGDRLQIERLTKLWRLAQRDLDLHAPFIEANSPG